MTAASFAELLRRQSARLADRQMTDNASEALARSLGEPRDSPPKPRPELLERIRTALIQSATSNQWDNIPALFWSHAPWTFWRGDPATVGLHPEVLRRYGEFLMKYRRAGRSLQRLIDAWMDACRPDLPEASGAVALIKLMLSRRGGPVAETWAVPEAEFGMFDSVGGARRVGEAMARSREETRRVLSLCGLDDENRRNGGFGIATFRAFLEKMSSDLRAGAMSEDRLKGLLSFIGAQPAWRGNSSVAHCLLRPWLGDSQPTPQIRDAIRAYVIEAFGDPRTPGNARWQPVDRAAEHVFRRWLAAITLREFFDVISDRADEAHWRYRNAFWTAVLDADLVEDAWVLLGRDVQEQTRSRFGNDIPCGRLIGFAGGQSVILMRVRNLVVAEVSHSGALRIWRDGDAQAPAMGRSEMRRVELVAPCLNFGTSDDPQGLHHDGSTEGKWQGNAARLIFDHTRARLGPSDYMPR